MWRQDDLFAALVGAGNPFAGTGRRRRGDGAETRRQRGPPVGCRPARSCTARVSSRRSSRCPRRGSGVTLEPAASTSTSCSTRSSARPVTNVVIVGEAFAKPILEHLDADPGRGTTCRAVPGRVVGRDVEPGEQAGPAAPAPGHDPVRLLRLVGGRRAWAVRVGGRQRRADGQVQLGENTAVITDDGRRSSPGRRDRPGGRRRLPSRSATTRTRQVGATFLVIEGERWTHPRRLRHGRRRRHAPPPRPGLGVHQHRRREGLPRGGRGGAEDAPQRAGRGRRRHPRRALRRGDLRRWSSPPTAPPSTRPS